MQDLLILGQVPFTNVYINFWGWLGLVLLALVIGWLIHSRKRLLAWALAVYVAWLMRRYKLGLIR